MRGYMFDRASKAINAPYLVCAAHAGSTLTQIDEVVGRDSNQSPALQDPRIQNCISFRDFMMNIVSWPSGHERKFFTLLGMLSSVR